MQLCFCGYTKIRVKWKEVIREKVEVFSSPSPTAFQVSGSSTFLSPDLSYVFISHKSWWFRFLDLVCILLVICLSYFYFTYNWVIPVVKHLYFLISILSSFEIGFWDMAVCVCCEHVSFAVLIFIFYMTYHI